MRRLALLALCIAYECTSAQSLPEAFSAGSAFGRSGNAAARARIDQGTAASTVPGYTTSAPAASYFGGATLGPGASATLAACAGAQAAANPACQAINFSQTNPGTRPQFSIAPNNPMLVRSKAISADPQAIAGNLAGTYSGCSVQTVTQPDIFEQRICNEYRTLERLTCDKTLIVTVTDNGLNCSAGAFLTPNPRVAFIRPYVYVGAICADDIRFLWTYGFSECNGTDDSIFVHTVIPSEEPTRLIVDLGCGGVFYITGSCPNGNCAYTVGLPDYVQCIRRCAEDCCPEYIGDYPLANFTFERPRRTYTVTDAWDNQCAPFEARLP